ncbi:MAG: carboxypeptidase regulatory-like domain-containing protein [Phycisphaerae bacterium]|nr:carboxypeptidase regulatory-like domain-containing protein [Phycisphaerae bacterium]
MAAKKKVKARSKKKADDLTQWGRTVLYAAISLGSFLCALLLLVLLLWKADKLTALGLTGNLYYLILLPLGLSVAAFLFGTMKSYARYTGKHLGGTLVLGGPIVAVAMVVIGGFCLVPDVTTFPLTVYVHGESGQDSIVLKNTGYVLIDLGLDRRREPIGDKGQAYFPAIPASFRGQEVIVLLESDTYEPANSGQKHNLDGTSLYLPVRKKSGRIYGRVQDEAGRPLLGVTVTGAGLSMQTDKNGSFELAIPPDLMQEEFSLQAVATGYAPWHGTVVANANETVVILREGQ